MMCLHHLTQEMQTQEASDLFGIELIQLRLLAVASPETQHLGLGAVGHVDEFLVPPAFINSTDVAAQDYAIIANLEQ